MFRIFDNSLLKSYARFHILCVMCGICVMQVVRERKKGESEKSRDIVNEQRERKIRI